METKQYFEKLRENVDKVYSLAGKAKGTGLDPVDKVEVPLAMTMAEKVVGLISIVYPQLIDSGIAERINELEDKFGKLDTTVTFIIAEEVAKQKFCKFDSVLEAIDCGIRVAFAYQTIAVVASPIEGYTHLEIGKTKDGKEYFIPYFSGPIRSAGTTAGCVMLMVIDYLREIFGYAKYDPDENEIKRYVTENTDYHERVTNLQYFPLPEEMEFLARHLPVQIAGDPTEKLEVSNYKNLERVNTNYIRGGMCLIFSEGLAQKAAKGFRLYNHAKDNGVKMTGFDWVKDYLELHEKLTSGKGKKKGDGVPVYIKDLVAGRPVYGHPSRSGAFRYRYGRSRVDGFSAVSIHPATMGITDDFIAMGTQLKVEKPTKGCVTMACDTIEGPIVKLINGSVKKPKTCEEAREMYKNVEEIIYLGDILFPFSDMANRNAQMIRPGYVEEWWNLELIEKNKCLKLDYRDVSFEEAVSFSNKYNIPLHPFYIFYWTQISIDQFEGLLDWLKHAKVSAHKLIFPYNKTEQERFEVGKRALEILGIEHDVTIENVVLNESDSKAFLANLGLDFSLLGNESGFFIKDLIDDSKFDLSKEILEIVNEVSEFEIKDKAGRFIGARMGRPEKAKLRKLVGSPNVLFPVGNEGGRLRSVHTACEVGKVKAEVPLCYCEKCNLETIYPYCEKCKEKTKKKYYFYETKEKLDTNKSEIAEKDGNPYIRKDLDINYYLQKSLDHLGMHSSELPQLIKGVRGLSSEGKQMENLAKGILRAKYGLQVNKDGTIRYDCTELPVVSFKPIEIRVSIEKLKELGYEEDIYGKPLENENQILELKPHDVLLPSSPENPDERADDVFVKIAQFVDDELEKFYGLERFYNVKNREDLIGHLSVCMAPHNCAGVISRIVGFSDALGLMASPYMHAAMRRDCDGDEAAIMLLGDVLLNFSKKFLPSHRGGTQDAPLVLNAGIDAGEVDDQILDFELVSEGHYPLDLYKKAEQELHSSEVQVHDVKTAMKNGEDPFVGIGFTHDTSNFNDAVVCSSYKLIPTMQEKVDRQMKLVEKLRGADAADTARLIIDRHFMRDMRGNLRKFSMQGFRCVKCNESYRRPPLSGECSACKNGKIIFTIHEGGIKKYLEPAIDLANKYNLSTYMKQNLELVKSYIDSIFGKELEKQTGLNEWF